MPFYRNFTGTIKEASEGRFHISGTVTLRPSRKNAHYIQVHRFKWLSFIALTLNGNLFPAFIISEREVGSGEGVGGGVRQ